MTGKVLWLENRCEAAEHTVPYYACCCRPRSLADGTDCGNGTAEEFLRDRVAGQKQCGHYRQADGSGTFSKSATF